ncbi:MAG: hypothetical protein WD749_01560 [Phycisphaerales bacterium]
MAVLIVCLVASMAIGAVRLATTPTEILGGGFRDLPAREADRRASPQPSGDGAKQPKGDGAKQPSGDGAKQPEGDGAKQPKGDGAKQPEGDGAEGR